MSAETSDTTGAQGDDIPPQIVEFIDEHADDVSQAVRVHDNTALGYSIRVDAKRFAFQYLPDEFRVTGVASSVAWDGVRVYIREERGD